MKVEVYIAVGCSHAAYDTRGKHDKAEYRMMMMVSTKWTNPCMDTEAHHDTGKTPWQRQQEILDSSRVPIDNSLYMDLGNFIQYVHVDDEPLSGHDRLVRDMVQKLQQKFLVKKVDYASTVGDKFQILGRTVERSRLGYRIITSRRYIDQRRKDMDMEKCNPVSTPCLQVTEKDLATDDQFPEVLAGLYRRVTGRLLYVAGQRLDVQQAVKELARGMSAPTNIH